MVPSTFKLFFYQAMFLFHGKNKEILQLTTLQLRILIVYLNQSWTFFIRNVCHGWLQLSIILTKDNFERLINYSYFINQHNASELRVSVWGLRTPLNPGKRNSSPWVALETYEIDLPSRKCTEDGCQFGHRWWEFEVWEVTGMGFWNLKFLLWEWDWTRAMASLERSN